MIMISAESSVFNSAGIVVLYNMNIIITLFITLPYKHIYIHNIINTVGAQTFPAVRNCSRENIYYYS